jgi:hypothetical protein
MLEEIGHENENESELAENAEEAPVDEIGNLREEITRLRTEMEDLRKTGREEHDGFVTDVPASVEKPVEKEDELGGIVQDLEGGRYRDALENLLRIVNSGNLKEPEVIAGGAIERESFMNAKGLEDLHGKVELAMELRRHGIPRADVVRMLRASAAKSERTRVEEPTARVTRPVDENKIIEGYWKKALA